LIWVEAIKRLQRYIYQVRESYFLKVTCYRYSLLSRKSNLLFFFRYFFNMIKEGQIKQKIK